MPIDQLVCKKCGYTWVPRVPSPKECARCKHRAEEWEHVPTEREVQAGEQLDSPTV